MSVLSAARAREVVEAALATSGADDVHVQLRGGTRSNLRFALNGVTTSGTDTDAELSVTSSFGTQSGTASGNRLSAAGIAEIVQRSESLARVAPEDPEHVPSIGPQAYDAIEAWFPSTDDGAVARGVRHCIDEAEAKGLVAAGYAEWSQRFSCFATRNGAFGYHRSTRATVSETVRTPDGRGSGWATRAANRPDDLDFEGLSAAATDKAAASVGARQMEPGPVVAILEPACVASLVGMLLRGASARRADEGRSFYAGADGGTRVGDKLWPDGITVRSDPADVRAPTAPWGSGGVPHRPRAWIDDGVVSTLSCSRYWAQKTGREPVPGPPNYLMDGEDRSVEDLVAETERGVLITSLWYIRMVDPRTLLYTGLTRDGVFWIEDGAIAYPLTNFRWNESPASVLEHAVARSRAVRVSPRGSRATNLVVPGLKTGRFLLSSVSDAV